MIFYVKITGYDIKRKEVSKTIAVQVQGYDYNTAADVALFEAQSMNLADVVVDTIKATKIHVVHAPQKSEGYTGWYLVSFDNTETQWAELFKAYDMRELQALVPDRGRDIVYAYAIKREKIAAYVSIETYEHDPQYRQAMHQWHIKKAFAKAERLSAEISEKLDLD